MIRRPRWLRDRGGSVPPFFQVQPGMTVDHGLPGNGGYSRFLTCCLDGEGTLRGANYAESIWPMLSAGESDSLTLLFRKAR